MVLKSYEKNGPTYIRLTNAREAKTYKEKPNLEIGKASILREGKDILIIASGLQAGFSLQVANELKKQGHDIKVVSMHTIKPINKKNILELSENIKNIFLFEEHSNLGGAGSAVAEILLGAGWKGKFKVFGVPDEFSKDIGTADYLRSKYLLDEDGILKTLLKEI